jgi:hypothetical protein
MSLGIWRMSNDTGLVVRHGSACRCSALSSMLVIMAGSTEARATKARASNTVGKMVRHAGGLMRYARQLARIPQRTRAASTPGSIQGLRQMPDRQYCGSNTT